MNVEVRRAFDYDAREKADDDWVLLADPVWPRGLRKEVIGVDEWVRHLAPSTALRRWFNHQPEHWHDFLDAYRDELSHCWHELERLARLSLEKRLILLFGARERQHNAAVALRHFIEEILTR